MSRQHKRGQRTGRRQYAALPVMRGETGALVMLVTSRETGRWVLPKGWPKKHLTGPETAAAEAFEEAGLIGDMSPTPIGFFHYTKRMRDGGTVPCDVDVYVMAVARLLDEWPEQAQRQRKWFTLTEAAGAVHEADLTALFLRVARAPVRLPDGSHSNMRAPK